MELSNLITIDNLKILKKEVLIREADFWVGTKETQGDNDGEIIRMFQRAVGTAGKEAWCMGFQQFCVQKVDLLIGNSIYSKLPMSESVMEVWNKAPNECKILYPRLGTIACWNFVGTSKGHCGVVRDWQSPEPEIFYTVEGNTADSAEIVREGDGVFRRRRSMRDKFHLLGFLDPWP